MVQSPFLFHLFDNMAYRFLFIFFQMEGLLHQMVPFHQLACGKTYRYARCFRMVLDEVHNTVKGPVHRAPVVLGTAEIPDARLFPVPGHMNRMAHQLLHSLVLGGGNGNHRNLQDFFHFINEDGAAVLLHLVHHVQRQHHGHIQFHELHGEIQVPFQIRGVHNVDNGAGLLFQNKLAGHDFLAGVGRQGINARKIHHFAVRMALDETALPIHRDTGEITYVLVGAGELVKEGGFPAVLIPCQRKNKLPLHRLRIMVRRKLMHPPRFPKARMLDLCRNLHGLFLQVPVPHMVDFYLFCIFHPKRQLIALHHELHRVSQRRKLDKRHLRPGNEAHVKKMLAQRSLSANRCHICRLPLGQFIQCHSYLSLVILLFYVMVPRLGGRFKGKRRRTAAPGSKGAEGSKGS